MLTIQNECLDADLLEIARVHEGFIDQNNDLFHSTASRRIMDRHSRIEPVVADMEPHGFAVAAALAVTRYNEKLVQTRPAIVTVTRKIGQNRGKPRLWIEGKALTEAGFVRGDAFGFSFDRNGKAHIVRDGTAPGARPRKVSGKADKPIIDIAGSSLGALGEAASVTLSYLPGSGVITVEAV